MPSPTGPAETEMRLEPWRTAVSRQRQQRYHEAAEVRPGLFADSVDPSILANDTILATRYLKTHAVDELHAGQRMIQNELRLRHRRWPHPDAGRTALIPA